MTSPDINRRPWDMTPRPAPPSTFAFPFDSRQEAHLASELVRSQFPRVYVAQFGYSTPIVLHYLLCVPNLRVPEATSCKAVLEAAFGRTIWWGNYEDVGWIKLDPRPTMYERLISALVKRRQPASTTHSRQTGLDCVRRPARLGWMFWMPASRDNWSDLVAGWEVLASKLESEGMDQVSVRRAIWRRALRAWWPLMIQHLLELLRLIQTIRSFTHPRGG